MKEEFGLWWKHGSEEDIYAKHAKLKLDAEKLVSLGTNSFYK